ncbi:hypothetical protein MUK70_08490 [Dyadobacter chenwenxiniae]|uniref:Uncharacterized protein n=1 Tax=Dyadobacter chenwenxiniae TaxID=2906456 RepID=A0A9X1TLW1_9BACT|nr:DUF6882 domain-containing protein [Dyadobacter chenwenxiniae]MCF0062803.1 hypothetical protein [Dyadobacter chenwenxiniae]UON85022.1 hypothetical protein MUK70_08490 [Dyadobacter chenwenxiniae]
MEYHSFAKDCIDELKVLQEKFNKDYDLDSYANWFYDQATGLLTFSSNEPELNFKYFEVGSFSHKSDTWMWSWHNENTSENAKVAAKQIKDFGERCGFTKLTNGCFEIDEFEAWEFVAIAAKVINGIGAYRPVNDNGLKIFLVITEHVDNETAKNIKNKYIECSDHEYRRVAFVCQHLNFATRVGFEESFETLEGMELSEEDDFQAWCDQCESIRVLEDGWNHNTMKFAKLRVVCEACYFKMKELNLGSV